MNFLSLFSGVEAASLAFNPLGWKCVGVSEIEPFPCAVLKHHYPAVPNLGDVTKITQQQIEQLGHIDVVIGGFPCQDLSVAGKRKGLHDHETNTKTRSGLFFDGARIADWSKARWTVVENVPGLFSSHGGRDFAAVVGELAGCEISVPGDGWRNAGVALGPKGLVQWFVLDAQYFGVAQRRRRVFFVRDAGNWADTPPIFLNAHSLSRNPPPRRETRERLAPSIAARTRGGGGLGTDAECDGALIPIQEIGKRQSSTAMNAVVHSLRADGFDASEDGTGRGVPIVPQLSNALCSRDYKGARPEADQGAPLVATSFEPRMVLTTGGQPQKDLNHTLRADENTGDGKPCVQYAMQVRRLTVVECSRLQGMPDDYLNVPYRGKPAKDGPRYKAIGNSFAVPVIRWIGQQLTRAAQYPKE